ncbi:hypothetical protein ASG31_17250 [Chryseobacterium sp. Leaf404]|uniref:DUF5074 domain-containing protein n=1 Tax=unclassified Chryseobacterium TaxID=2593645 RepID=UPI0006F5FF94|nr:MULTISPECIES: DUF5074 domain-containing protein [unclassified Chryseobacterium]KQT20514.1 hypothetical protein ASG31_17250 [Chryseobacterium sp. Leaf404]
MKISKILSLAFASALLFNVSCSNDDFTMVEKPLTYENGILVANEGGFSTPTAEVSFVSSDLGTLYNKIYDANNKEILGNVLQSIGFSGDKAYLVSNVPNKIDIVNRYSFKKQTTVTTNLDNPRYIAFSGSKYFVTNNNFSTVKKLNIYNSDNTFVSSINFPRFSEKIVEAGGNIVVQTDGTTYASTPPYAEMATGYTVTVVNPSSNAVSSTIMLPSNGIIRDLISYNGSAYVLASDNTTSYIYKLNATAGTFSTTTLTGISAAQKLRIDGDKFYFADSTNKIYTMALTATAAPTASIVTTPGTLYGFNVIDGKIYASEASFSSDSKVHVYNAANGTLLKTFTAGIGTNGFYKN